MNEQSERKSVELKFDLGIASEIVVYDLFNSLEYRENLKKIIDLLIKEGYDLREVPIRFKPPMPEKRNQEWYKVASEYLYHTVRIYEQKNVKNTRWILSKEWFDLLKEQKEARKRIGGLELSTTTIEKILHGHKINEDNETTYDRIFLAKKKYARENKKEAEINNKNQTKSDNSIENLIKY